jgi:polyferredoxin/Pyruvate/2-oxoacid:ferredoxin oxidoreductase delta subunit
LKKLNWDNLARIRRLIQIIFLIFFFFLFIRARYPYEIQIESDVFLRFSPLAPLFYFIDSLRLPAFFWPAFLILLLTPFLGRFFCGWICPLGTSLDVFRRFFKSPSNRISIKWVKLRWIKFGILSTAIVAALFSLNIWGYFDPLGIFTRMVTVLFHPLSTFLAEKSLVALTEINFLEDFFYHIYDWFKTVIMPENQPQLAGIVGILLLTIFIFGSEKLSGRFWCRNICPAGAFLGLLSQFRLFERLVAPTCPVCNKCQVECRMNAIPEKNIPQTSKVECVQCLSCADECPPKYKSITYRFKFKPYRSQPDFSRRQFMGSMATGMVTLTLVGFSLPDKTGSTQTIRPPGALPESDFLDRCIRCLECVRICESNGCCLQVSGFNLNLLELWTPVAKMREGYCEYNCNLCGQVCPTDALLPLTLEQKQKTPIGLAYFDKNLCIPFVRDEDCIVCEEHCPTPEKAIKFEIKEVIFPDGTLHLVKYPYVVRDLCIGCGICENKCPLPGRPGIFVVRENEKRWANLDSINFENQINDPQNTSEFDGSSPY